MTYRDDDAARTALAAALARRRLPMLDRLEVASPCNRDWDDMMRTADEHGDIDPSELSVVMGETGRYGWLPEPPAGISPQDDGSEYSQLLYGLASASFDVPDLHVGLDIDRDRARVRKLRGR